MVYKIIRFLDWIRDLKTAHKLTCFLSIVSLALAVSYAQQATTGLPSPAVFGMGAPTAACATDASYRGLMYLQTDATDGHIWLCDQSTGTWGWDHVQLLNPDWNASTGVAQILNKPTVFGSCYDGSTKRANCIPYYTVLTVASGIVTANMTTDGTSTGSSIFPNGLILGSINVICNDATVPYSTSYPTPTSATKSLVITANKASGVLSILGLSVLGAPAAANGAVCNVQAMGW